MKVPRDENVPDPDKAFDDLQKFLRGVAVEGEVDHHIHMMAVGVFIGCRLGLIDRDIALALTEHGNTVNQHDYQAARGAVETHYAARVEQRMAMLAYQLGFTDATTDAHVVDEESRTQVENIINFLRDRA